MGEWFDTGLLMNDGKSVRTVYADSEVAREEFLKKGWKVVEKKKVVKRRKLLKKVPKEKVNLKTSSGKVGDE